MCLFRSGSFVSNIAIIPCRYDPDYEDRWYFNPEKTDGENTVLFNITNLQEATLKNTELVLELVMFVKRENSNKCVVMSSGFSKMSINEL